jgi:glycogen debranching enzyme
MATATTPRAAARRRSSGPALIALALLVTSAAAAAQDSSTVKRFSLGDSPIALTGDARPGVYLAAVGRRSIAMGSEDGRFEIWSWPIKWLHDFQLAFRVPKYSTPIAGRDVARHVTVRPEGVTIEYAYETFTVRQHIFAVLDQPAVIMLLEVQAVRPMEIVATFVPDVHYAWPAALGGQYLVWNAEARAFLFSESRRRINALLGSPAVTRASDVPAHMLAAAPPEFVIGVGGAGERYTEPRLGEPPGHNVNLDVAFIPIVLAGGEMPRDSVRALYARLSAPGAAEREWRRRQQHADSIRLSTLSIATPDPALDRAVEWAKVNLDDAMVCNPDLGCGLVAGYGLSGASSDRPGFGWFFGGDASINSFAMSAAGQFDLARDGAFRFFAKYQRADGKITHEISQGAGKIDWFGAYPYAFYHGDTTPFWILAFGEYWRASGDTALVRELWPNLKKAWEWSRRTDTDGDGLMENTSAGAGALEVGDLQIGIVSDVYLGGVWIASLDRFARMAEAMGEPRTAAEARAIRTKALATLESKLWLPGLRQYAFAILERGQVNENLTAWPATAMSFDVFDRDRGAEMASRLAGSGIMTDWGARPLSASSTLFDPLHYNNGAVWPFVTGWVALAEYRYHNAAAGRFALEAIARTGFDEARGFNPEVLSGRLYKPLDTAVPQQFFATSMVLTPLVRGLFGVDVDAPARRLTLAPHLPPDWGNASLRQLRVGADRVSVDFERGPGMVRATVRRASAATPLDVTFSPALPLGATVTSVSRGDGGGPLSFVVDTTPGDVHARASVAVCERETITVSYSGGWSAWLAPDPPRIGDRSHAARIVEERLRQGEYLLTLEGRAGASYAVTIDGPREWRVLDDAIHPVCGESGTRCAVTVPFGADSSNADGYRLRTLRFRAP